jgi:hypothetical protein
VTFFRREDGKSMNRKSNGHSAEYLKRQAKNIKRELGVSHHKALDIAAINAGFTNYKNFLNGSVPVAVINPKRVKAATKLPYPLTLTYFDLGFPNGAKRPNAKPRIQWHQEAGKLLKALMHATEYSNYKAFKPIRSVLITLDEWLQNEYPDRKVLSDEVFSEVYTGENNWPRDESPSIHRIEELVRLCEDVKEAISKGYHDCQPIRTLSKKLDSAKKWIYNWPVPKSGHGMFGRKRLITPGSLVRIKSNLQPAILISHDGRNDVVVCYNDRGAMTAGRHEISVAKDQSGASAFKPLRLVLPYGKWICADGTEVLFNRDYCPLWAKSKDGVIEAIDPDFWIAYEEQHHYFNDGTVPWRGDKKKLTELEGVLEEWNVKNKEPKILALLVDAVSSGHTNVLKPKNREKAYPPLAS